MSGSRVVTSLPVALLSGAFEVLKYIVRHPTKALIATLLLTKPAAVESQSLPTFYSDIQLGHRPDKNVDALQKLTFNGAINLPDESSVSEIIMKTSKANELKKAIQKYDTATMVDVIKLHPLQDAVRKNADKLWIDSVSTGNLKGVKFLLESRDIIGLDIFKKYLSVLKFPFDDLTVDALSIAAFYGQVEIITYLFAKGFYHRQRNYFQFERCGYVAAENNQELSIQTLRSLGVDFSMDLSLFVDSHVIFYKEKQDMLNKFEKGAIQHRHRAMSLFLKYGANPNLKLRGKPLLYVVSEIGFVDAVNLLLLHNADMYQYYQDEWPIHVALENKNSEIIEAFLQHGFDITKHDDNNLSLIDTIAGIQQIAFHYPDSVADRFLKKLRLSAHSQRLFEQVDHIDGEELTRKHIVMLYRRTIKYITSSSVFSIFVSSMLSKLLAYLLFNKKYQSKNSNSPSEIDNTEQQLKQDVQIQDSSDTISPVLSSGVTETAYVPVINKQDLVSEETLEMMRLTREEHRKQKQQAKEAEERARQQKKLDKQLSLERAEREKAEAESVRKQHAEERRKIREEQKQKAKLEKAIKKVEIKPTPVVSTSTVTFFSNSSNAVATRRGPVVMTLADRSEIVEMLDNQEMLASYLHPIQAAINCATNNAADEMLVTYALLGSCARLMEFKKDSRVFRKNLAREFRNTVFHQDVITSEMLPEARTLAVKICAMYSDENVFPSEQKVRAVLDDALFVRFTTSTREEEKVNSQAVYQRQLDHFIQLQVQFQSCSADIPKDVVMAGHGLAIARAEVFASRGFGEQVRKIARSYRHNRDYTGRLSLFLETQSFGNVISPRDSLHLRANAPVFKSR